MFIIRISDNRRIPVIVEKITNADFRAITIKEFSFNWKLEKGGDIYKLRCI
jgi:hypothetical protein